MKKLPEFILFYDAQCPICRIEVNWLRSKNKVGRLGFQDINDSQFKPEDYGKTFDELMAEIHGVYPDGYIIKGVDVFVACYKAVGLGWIFAPTRWPVLKTLFDLLYVLFARYRLRLGLLFGASPCRRNSCIGKSLKIVRILIVIPCLSPLK
ncbi:DUF393 domain-containing protein [Methylomonas sp. AM2-LC]|uniref:thiol-disulfide oxidoreductase DCC family protein n=1 Tax=Methylomonas sp. AM2-LC TaxID=3153301 RepID=UPI0032644BE4